MSIVDKFWSLVQQDTETFCWGWNGRIDKGGYGIVGSKRAHRVSWEIHHGEIPKGMFVCHRCDNPKCCNPDHLFIGTAYDNNIDRVIKSKKVKVRALSGHASPSSITQAYARRIDHYLGNLPINETPQTWPEARDCRRGTELHRNAEKWRYGRSTASAESK